MKARNESGGVPLQFDDPSEARIWAELGEISPDPAPESLRRGFYQRLRAGEGEPWWRPRWLSEQPWAAALATLILGIGIGFGMSRFSAADDQTQILMARLSTLNRTVALALLENDSASDRLRGIRVASEAQDPTLTQALLATASNDPVASVRNAAIEALGPRLADPAIAAEIRRLLMGTEAVLVQMALADLMLRWGSDDDILFLIDQAHSGTLHEDVIRFVTESVREVSA